ncbi:MAG: SDR family NAD(P)-dependent oxidoreductase [Puniceicoccaceae bacterium]
MRGKLPESPGGRYARAWVTGGSSGIGKAICRALADQKIEVVATARDGKRADWGDGVSGESLDLSWPRERLREQVEAMVAAHGVPQILVNNAGYADFGFFERCDPDGIEKQLRVLLGAPMELVRELLPSMLDGGAGAVVNVASLTADLPMPGFGVYNAAKAGLAHFTQSLMLENNRSDFCFIDLRPGDFCTSFNDNTKATVETMSDREAAAWERAEHHLRLAPPPEKAAADLLRILRKGKSGTYRTGSFFQARLAATGGRFLPGSWIRWLIRRYYRCP